MCRATDFFYERGNLLKDLLTILGEERTIRSTEKDVRIYKFILAVQTTQREKAEFIRVNGRNYCIIVPEEAYKKACKSLKDAIKHCAPSYENLVFLDRVESILFAIEYLNQEVNDTTFVESLSSFCEDELLKKSA